MTTTIALMAQGGTGWLGGLQYTAHLIEALSQLPPDERTRIRVLLFAGDEQRTGLRDAIKLVDDCVTASAKVGIWERAQDSLRRRVLGYSDPWTARSMRRLSVDFVYPHHVRDWHRRIFRSAAWLPDFQHERMPEMFAASELTQRRERFAEVARFADRIVLSSSDARRDLAENHGDAVSRSVVLPFPSCPQARWFEMDAQATRRRYHLPERYLLVCNQFWKHKNHAQLWRALELLALDDIRPEVVLTGHTHDYRNPGHFNELLQDAHLAGISAQLHFLGVIPREEQVQLMRGAAAMVQPSRFEGWSTVVEDARALGCPILMSDIPVHREQAPPFGTYFALDDVAGLAALLRQLWRGADKAHDEYAARTDNSVRVLEFARRFVDLAEGRL